MLASAARVARARVDTRAALSEPSSSSTTPRGAPRVIGRGASSTGSRRGGARGGGRASSPRRDDAGGGRDWPSVTLGDGAVTFG